DFSCGKEILDIYFKTQANQDIKRKLSTCFVLVDKDFDLIKGYYTLSNSSIPLDLVPEKVKKKLPKSYKNIPTTLLGRLAVDLNYQRKGIGKILLIDSLKRSYEISKTIGSFAVIVDPLDEDAEVFYSKYGFVKLPESGKMFLTLKTIELLFKD
ncbi:MAG TPA: GNAT family N-acetyltransferase, partial [Hanamia sp.]|nr:GNAT family N-acetyltransferase [Hanamia sp.]